MHQWDSALVTHSINLFNNEQFVGFLFFPVSFPHSLTKIPWNQLFFFFEGKREGNGERQREGERERENLKLDSHPGQSLTQGWTRGSMQGSVSQH